MNNDELASFTREVLLKSADSCLPRNLSAYWLDLITKDADEFLEDSDQAPVPPSILGPVYVILKYQKGGDPIEVGVEELIEYCACYSMALIMERFHRVGWITLDHPRIDNFWEGKARFELHEERIPMDILLWMKAKIGALEELTPKDH